MFTLYNSLKKTPPPANDLWIEPTTPRELLINHYLGILAFVLLDVYIVVSIVLSFYGISSFLLFQTWAVWSLSLLGMVLSGSEIVYMVYTCYRQSHMEDEMPVYAQAMPSPPREHEALGQDTVNSMVHANTDDEPKPEQVSTLRRRRIRAWSF